MGVMIHDTAIVDAGAEIGDGTRIWHWTHITKSAKIGKHCSIGQNVYVGAVTIGDNVKIQNNVSVYDGVFLEDFVFCGPSMVFTNVVNPRSHVVRKHEYRQTIVCKGATIGANATVICGNRIGSFAMIAAGAVVTRAVPDYALMIGAPARRKGWICKCGVTLPASASPTCTVCRSQYSISSEVCRMILKDEQ
jgi:UDP-2-acetamido-3-amino-2,3-dideoxy-glucuronate N-acetyltransferase